MRLTITIMLLAMMKDAIGRLEFVPVAHEARIYEGAPSGVFVTRVVVGDTDGPAAATPVFRIHESADHGFFSIDAHTGDVTTKRNIDRPLNATYSIIVVSYNQGVSEYESLQVRVTEYNMYPPVFETTLYREEIHILMPLGEPIVHVRAADADAVSYNSEVYYRLVEEGSTGLFQIHRKTGAVTLRRHLEPKSRLFRLVAVAEDGGSPLRRARAALEVQVKVISMPEELKVVSGGDTWALSCWKAPRLGTVLGYLLQVREKAHGLMARVNATSSIGNKGGETGLVETKDRRMCLNVSGLAPWTEYEFSVYAWNAREVGMASGIIEYTTKADYCKLQVCQNGECVPTPTKPGYRCICPPGFYGSDCDRRNPCFLNPCSDYGTCRNTSDVTYECECLAGFYGSNCSQFDPCAMTPSPCQSGGTCLSMTSNQFTCLCRSGYSGTTCEIYNQCQSSPCQHGGKCIYREDGSFECICMAGFEGKVCEAEINECSSSPCKNGGMCSDAVNSFHCTCPPGYSGKQCEVDLEVCKPSPCQNGGNCTPNANQFECRCTLGFEGELCEQKVNCPEEMVTGPYGTLTWPKTQHGSIVRQPCPFGSKSIGPSDVVQTTLNGALGQRGFFQWANPPARRKRGVKIRPGRRADASERDPAKDHARLKDWEYRESTEGHPGVSPGNSKLRPRLNGVPYAIRVCSWAGGLVHWGEVNSTACGIRAEEMARGLEQMTRGDPLAMGPSQVHGAAQRVSQLVSFAISDPKMANRVFSAVSRLMEANHTAMEGSGDIILDAVHHYATGVPLGSNESVANIWPNMAIKVTLVASAQLDSDIELSAPYAPHGMIIPSEALRAASNDTRLLFFSFRNAKLFWPSYGPAPPVDQEVIVAEIANLTVQDLSHPVVYYMPVLAVTSPRCVYWDGVVRQWKSDGITTVAGTASVECQSNHLTAFSVLLEPLDNDSTPYIHRYILSIISYVGSGLSTLGLALTIATYSLFRSLNRDHSGKILLNLCLALLLLNAAFLAGSLPGTDGPWCRATGALVHYLVLASLAWMLVEAVNMYQMLVTVFATAETRFMAKRLAAAWGIPLVVVGATVGSGPQWYSRGNGEFCLLSPRHPYAYYLAYLAPCCVMLAVNCVVFFLVSRVLFQKRAAGKTGVEKEKGIGVAQVRGAFTVMALLGVTWIFGVFSVGGARLFFQYLFCLCNSLQGFIIFVVRCLHYPEARSAWTTLLVTGRRKKRRGWPPSATSLTSHSQGSSGRHNLGRAASMDTSSSTVAQEKPQWRQLLAGQQRGTRNGKVVDSGGHEVVHRHVSGAEEEPEKKVVEEVVPPTKGDGGGGEEEAKRVSLIKEGKDTSWQFLRVPPEGAPKDVDDEKTPQKEDPSIQEVAKGQPAALGRLLHSQLDKRYSLQSDSVANDRTWRNFQNFVTIGGQRVLTAASPPCNRRQQPQQLFPYDDMHLNSRRTESKAKYFGSKSYSSFEDFHSKFGLLNTHFTKDF